MRASVVNESIAPNRTKEGCRVKSSCFPDACPVTEVVVTARGIPIPGHGGFFAGWARVKIRFCAVVPCSLVGGQVSFVLRISCLVDLFVGGVGCALHSSVV